MAEYEDILVEEASKIQGEAPEHVKELKAANKVLPSDINSIALH